MPRRSARARRSVRREATALVGHRHVTAWRPRDGVRPTQRARVDPRPRRWQGRCIPRTREPAAIRPRSQREGSRQAAGRTRTLRRAIRSRVQVVGPPPSSSIEPSSRCGTQCVVSERRFPRTRPDPPRCGSGPRSGVATGLIVGGSRPTDLSRTVTTFHARAGDAVNSR